MIPVSDRKSVMAILIALTKPAWRKNKQNSIMKYARKVLVPLNFDMA